MIQGFRVKYPIVRRFIPAAAIDYSNGLLLDMRNGHSGHAFLTYFILRLFSEIKSNTNFL